MLAVLSAESGGSRGYRFPAGGVQSLLVAWIQGRLIHECRSGDIFRPIDDQTDQVIRIPILLQHSRSDVTGISSV